MSLCLFSKERIQDTGEFPGGFPAGSAARNLPANAGNKDLIPGSGKSPGEGNGNPFQHSCLENPVDGEAWWVTVHRVAKSWT